MIRVLQHVHPKHPPKKIHVHSFGFFDTSLLYHQKSWNSLKVNFGVDFIPASWTHHIRSKKRWIPALQCPGSLSLEDSANIRSRGDHMTQKKRGIHPLFQSRSSKKIKISGIVVRHPDSREAHLLKHKARLWCWSTIDIVYLYTHIYKDLIEGCWYTWFSSLVF